MAATPAILLATQAQEDASLEPSVEKLSDLAAEKSLVSSVEKPSASPEEKLSVLSAEKWLVFSVEK